MTREDLSPIMKQAYDSLQTEKQKLKFLEQYENFHNSLIRGSISKVVARNFSHGVGCYMGLKKV